MKEHHQNTDENPIGYLIQQRCKDIEVALVEAAMHCRKSDEYKAMSRKRVNDKLKILGERRKTLQNQAQPDRGKIKFVHKEFQK